MAAKRSSASGSMKITSFFSTEALGDEGSDEESEAPPRKQTNSKHRMSFDPSWQEQFSWLIYVPEDDDGEGPSMYCSLCQKHNTTIRSTPWVNTPCRMFRRDKLREHQASKRHADSVVSESHAVAAKSTGGIRAAMEQQVVLKRQAVMGALKCLYWLAKEETAHHTKFSSLL